MRQVCVSLSKMLTYMQKRGKALRKKRQRDTIKGRKAPRGGLGAFFGGFLTRNLLVGAQYIGVPSECFREVKGNNGGERDLADRKGARSKGDPLQKHDASPITRMEKRQRRRGTKGGEAQELRRGQQVLGESHGV